MMSTRALTLTRAILGVLLSLSAVHGGPVSAQGPTDKPIFVALPEEFPDLDARAVVVREPGRDIIVLDETDAEPETLQVALAVLARMSREHPVPEDRGQLIPITGFVYRDAMGPDRRSSLEAVLAELRQRPTASVGNLGPGRWLRYEGS